jgi:hypothetical protein
MKPVSPTPYLGKCANCMLYSTIVAKDGEKGMCHKCVVKRCSEMENVMTSIAQKMCKVCPKVKTFLKKPPVVLRNVNGYESIQTLMRHKAKC